MKILYTIFNIENQRVITEQGYITQLPQLHVDDDIAICAQILDQGIPYALSGVRDVLFGLNTAYGLSSMLYATTSISAVPQWDSFEDGRLSWRINLRNQNIYDVISNSSSIPLIAEVWVRNTDEENYVILTQQNILLQNHVVEFPGICGIGTMAIEATAGCVFKIY